MPRPCKRRRICLDLKAYRFKPCGRSVEDLAEIVLETDELEALRLADREGLYQEEAARRMRVSRQTFGNIIERARRKVASALVEGRSLRVNCPKAAGSKKRMTGGGADGSEEKRDR